MPKVSVIVPNYNHAPYLEQRIESILNQTYQDFELILLDDCSTDNSLEVLSMYAKHPKLSHYIVNEQNSGSTFLQWDKGINLAKGEYVWIAESDDWAEREFLERMVFSITKEQAKTEVSFCFCQSNIADSLGNKIELYNNDFEFYKYDSTTKGSELIEKYLHSGNIFPNASAIVFNKSFYQKVNLIDLVQFKINGDWYLWINLLLNGYCVFIAETLNNFRRHDGAGSPRNVLNFKNVEEAMKINVFLKQQGLKYKDKFWLKFWFEQANYNIKRIFKNNFVPIFKNAILLTPFSLPYLTYIFLKHKFKNQ